MAIALNVVDRISLFSDSRIKKMLSASDRESATHISLFDRFKDLFRNENKKEKVNALYDALHSDLKAFRDESVNKVIIFSKIKNLANPDKWDEFKILPQEKEMNFQISGKSVYICKVSDIADEFIRERCLFANDTVKNTDELKELVKKDKNMAAVTIQKFFRLHKEKIDEKIALARENNKQFALTEYKGHNSENYGRKYYFDTTTSAEKHPVLYAPVEKPATDLRGMDKHVVGMDHRFVALSPNDIEHGEEFGFEQDKKDNQDVANIKTVKYGVVVDNATIIARNAGTVLTSIIGEHVLDVNAFNDAAHDLATLHKQGIYLRDIKINNMAWDGKNANFIDVDDRISEVPDYQAKRFTVAAMTAGLINGAYKITTTDDGNVIKSNDYTYLRTADEYAFLLAMITATTKNISLRESVMAPDVDSIRGNYPGAMNPGNKENFNDWINGYVKPEHRSDVAQLLTDPAYFTQQSPGRAYLSEMLYFPITEFGSFALAVGAELSQHRV